MTERMLVFLFVGTLLMWLPITSVARKYEIKLWKSTIATILLTIFGFAGTYIMFYVENHWFGGVSFFGAVFLVPVAFLLVAAVLRIPYGKMMDFCAIGECVMLALMKVQCIIGGCCFGRELFALTDGTIVRFPSRSAEIIVALSLFLLMFSWAKKGKKQGQLYGWYLLLYGIIRFVLNILREEWVYKEMFLPYGNIWSLVAILLGIIWLGVKNKGHTGE